MLQVRLFAIWLVAAAVAVLPLLVCVVVAALVALAAVLGPASRQERTVAVLDRLITLARVLRNHPPAG